VHAAEHVATVAADVDDVRPPRVVANVDRAPRLRIGDSADDHHAEDVAAGVVRGDHRREIDVEDQLAVATHERLVAPVGIEQAQRVLEPATGAEQYGFVDVLDPRAVLPAVSDLALDDARQVVGVDHDVADAVRDEVGDPVREDRHPAHRQHRFGALGTEIPEPGR
jgi:hypothetical protein